MKSLNSMKSSSFDFAQSKSLLHFQEAYFTLLIPRELNSDFFGEEEEFVDLEGICFSDLTLTS